MRLMWPEYSPVDIGALSVLVCLPLTGLCGEGVTVWVSFGTAPDFAFAILLASNFFWQPEGRREAETFA